MQDQAQLRLRRWQNRSLTRESDALHARWLWAMLFGIVAALLPAGGYLLYQNECLEAQYALSALRAENDELTKVERRLRVERARLESLPLIETWASRGHELTQADPHEIFIVGGTEQAGEMMAHLPRNRPGSPAE